MDTWEVVKWIIGSEIALVGIFITVIGVLHTRRNEHITLLIAPISNQLKHQDECIDRLRSAIDRMGMEADNFRAKFQEELKSLSSQFTGIVLSITKDYPTKADLDTRIRDLNDQMISRLRNERSERGR